MKSRKTRPVNPPPDLAKHDKVLSELREAAEKSVKNYHDSLNSLHKYFLKEPQLIDEKLLGEVSNLKAALRLETSGFFQKLAAKFSRVLSLIFPWARRRRKIDLGFYRYLESLNGLLHEYSLYKGEFHTRLLKYSQDIGPYVNDLHSQVSRQVTVMPIERMDLIFMEMMRQIEDLKSEVARLQKALEKKE